MSHVHVEEPRQHHIHRYIQDRSRTEKQIKETRGKETFVSFQRRRNSLDGLNLNRTRRGVM